MTFRFGATLGDLNDITADDIVKFLRKVMGRKTLVPGQDAADASAQPVPLPVLEWEDEARSGEQSSTRRDRRRVAPVAI